MRRRESWGWMLTSSLTLAEMESQALAAAARTGAMSAGRVRATPPLPTFQLRVSWTPSSTSRHLASRMVARRHCLMEARVCGSTPAVARQIRLAARQLNLARPRQALGLSTRFASWQSLLTSDRLSPQLQCHRQVRHRPLHSQCLRHQDRLHRRRHQLHLALVAAGGPLAVKSTAARPHLVGALSQSRNAPRLAAASGVRLQGPPRICIRARRGARGA